MTITFNLVDRPWIPCLDADGAFVQFGLEESLAKAHELREICDDSPLVTAPLYRLLLAILHDNFGPANADAWMAIWQGGDGRFDRDVLHAYFHDPVRYRRFDLFDPSHPFYQTVAVPFEVRSEKTGETKSLTVSAAKLATELAAGNNDTLFDHSVDDRPTVFSAGQAARLLLGCQAYSPGGLVTCLPQEDRRVHGSADASPLVNGAVCLVRGSTLFHSLMLNLHIYNAEEEEPFAFDPNVDRPAWDRDDEVRPGDRRPRGYLDLLTWQSRRVRLRPELDSDGRIAVQQVVIMKGEQFPDGFHRRGRETMVAFARNLNAKGTQDPWPPVDFSEHRAIWRNSLALFQSVEEKYARPQTFDWLDDLVGQGVLTRSAVFPLDLLGLSSDRAKVLFWRHERMPLPLAYLDDDDLQMRLQSALHEAEETAKVLRKAVWKFATLLLLRDEGKQPGKEQKKDIQNLVEALAPDRLYWSQLEIAFYEFLRDLPRSAAVGTTASGDHRDRVLSGWRAKLRTVARDAFDQAVRREDTSARSLKAAVFAHRLFTGLLKKSFPETEVSSAATR